MREHGTLRNENRVIILPSSEGLDVWRKPMSGRKVYLTLLKLILSLRSSYLGIDCLQTGQNIRGLVLQ